MDFLKKLFGNNPPVTGQDNFVVDATGNAQEVSDAPVTMSVKAPNIPESPATVKQELPTPASQPVAEIKPINETNPPVETEPVEVALAVSKDEFVGETSAFDELMKQAENSVESRTVDPATLDPEFQKAKEEIEKEGGIEIFVGE
jgi:hypothetical protein